MLIIVIIVICLLMEMKSLNLKLTIKMLNYQLSFVSEVYLMGLVILSLENSIDKSDILNIHKYLMAKNNINNVLPVYYLFIACSLVR